MKRDALMERAHGKRYIERVRKRGIEKGIKREMGKRQGLIIT